MFNLAEIKNVSRPTKKIQRVGRGMGSGRGQTSCRGSQGDGARSGYRRRYGYEGGQVALYRKLPIRGFTRGRFMDIDFSIDLAKIEKYFNDGETVSRVTLREKKLMPRKAKGILKILSPGKLTRKVKIEADAFSAAAKVKLEALSIPFTVVSK